MAGSEHRQEGNWNSKLPEFLSIQTPEHGTWGNSAELHGSLSTLHYSTPLYSMIFAHHGKLQLRHLLTTTPSQICPMLLTLTTLKQPEGPAKAPLSQKATCGVLALRFGSVSSHRKAGGLHSCLGL